MRITRETLVRIAKETALKRALSDPALVAAYLTGSVLTDDPFLGGTADIDIVLVHPVQPKVRREIVPVTADIHLDICHNPRSQYDNPKELRLHPWFGPELYNPLPLYVTGHFFEFVQAGVRTQYHEPLNVLERSRRNYQHSREIWTGLQTKSTLPPETLLQYLKALSHAANAVALLNGLPLTGRRFLLQFPQRAEAAGKPGLAAGLLGLLGAPRSDPDGLRAFLPEWEKTFLDAAGRPRVHESIAAPRLAYYKKALESLLAGEAPQAALWPLVLTWTLSAAALPLSKHTRWQKACELLGLAGDALAERLAGLDHFLDTIEEMLENLAASNGLSDHPYMGSPLKSQT